MRDSRLEQSQMYYKNVLAKKITEDVNFVPAYEEAMEKIEAKIPHVIQLISHDHRAFKIVQDCALDLASAILKNNTNEIRSLLGMVVVGLHLEEMFIDSLNWNMPKLAREFIKLELVQNKLVLQRGRDMEKEMAKEVVLTY